MNLRLLQKTNIFLYSRKSFLLKLLPTTLYVILPQGFVALASFLMSYRSIQSKSSGKDRSGQYFVVILNLRNWILR